MRVTDNLDELRDEDLDELTQELEWALECGNQAVVDFLYAEIEAMN